jgi:hypothetical protein
MSKDTEPFFDADFEPAKPASHREKAKKERNITLPEMTRPRIYAFIGGFGVLFILSGIYITTRPEEPQKVGAQSKSNSFSSLNLNTWEVIVPPTENGVTLPVSLKKGDSLEITATGQVDIGRGFIGPDGEPGYQDTSVDSPYVGRVGGLEMWVGDKSNRYFVGSHFVGQIEQSGTLTFRVIESLNGYRDGNIGAFTVTIHKKSGQITSIRLQVPANVEWFDTGIDITGKVHIEYESGEWRNHPNSGTNDGRGRWPFDGKSKLIIPSGELSQLIGKVNSRLFIVGNSYQGSPGVGRLYLSINDLPGHFNDNSGSLRVVITLE